VPVITPFRALYYGAALRRDLDRLIAPPYDVIPEEKRADLAARHPCNIVHLDLPRPAPGEDPYAASAALLARLLREGVFERDSSRAIYACEQTFRSPAGERRVRRGLFARLRLEPFEAGVVIPHERTFDRPKEDRHRLLAATRTHLSPVFLLHPDPGGTVARTVATALEAAAFEQARDDEGTVIRVVRIPEGETTRRLAEGLAAGWALIADGHHRYESALAYREERRGAGADDAGQILAYLCSLEDPGLSIYPIHRLVHSLPGFDPDRFRERLEEGFSLSAVGSEADLRRALADRRGRPGVFGLVFPGQRSFFTAEWREGAGLEGALLAPIPEPLRRLDVILLHRLVLEGILGLTPQAMAAQSNLDYVKDERELYERVRRGGAQVGVLLNPTPMAQVVDVTRRGLRLPQKSTFFYPKVPAGLVLDPLDSGDPVPDPPAVP
jgi:uncharacterized protein (DUF1015 family)